jgi:hypothetical protein
MKVTRHGTWKRDQRIKLVINLKTAKAMNFVLTSSSNRFRCQLLALSGHRDRVEECPLSGVKQTLKFKSVTSAFDPKRTSPKVASISAADQKADVERTSRGQVAPRNLVAIAGR